MSVGSADGPDDASSMYTQVPSGYHPVLIRRLAPYLGVPVDNLTSMSAECGPLTLCLLNGLDDIALTLEKNKDIESYEQDLRNQRPWL